MHPHKSPYQLPGRCAHAHRSPHRNTHTNPHEGKHTDSLTHTLFFQARSWGSQRGTAQPACAPWPFLASTWAPPSLTDRKSPGHSLPPPPPVTVRTGDFLGCQFSLQSGTLGTGGTSWSCLGGPGDASLQQSYCPHYCQQPTWARDKDLQPTSTAPYSTPTSGHASISLAVKKALTKRPRLCGLRLRISWFWCRDRGRQTSLGGVSSEQGESPLPALADPHSQGGQSGEG